MRPVEVVWVLEGSLGSPTLANIQKGVGDRLAETASWLEWDSASFYSAHRANLCQGQEWVGGYQVVCWDRHYAGSVHRFGGSRQRRMATGISLQGWYAFSVWML